MKLTLVFLFILLTHMISAQTAEIKMLISEEQRPEAEKTLKVTGEGEPEVNVCFLDTGDALLDAHKLILRLRIDAKDQEADSVVKLRGADKLPADLGGVELQSDWTGPDDEKRSYSIKDESWDVKTMEQVLKGKLPVTRVLTEKQKEFAEACLAAAGGGELKWEALRRYGVIQAWKSKRNLGEFKKVTVETWKLTADGKKPLELLEISIKTDENDKRTPKEVAIAFYAAAEQAGLGKPTGESKTQKAIEYLKPGK